MSNLTAVAYYGGIPPTNNNPEKPLILDNFCHGVLQTGDTAVAHRSTNAIACDVAFIQGFVHQHGKSAPHLQLRQDVVNLQKQIGKRTLIVDSNLFLYADPKNTQTYLRYSFDGVFPTTGFYFDKDIDPVRWQKISTNLNICLVPYRTSGSHILVCLQRNGGWSMKGLHVQNWLDQTILTIRQHSDRPIVVRMHPGDKKIKLTLKINHSNVSISPQERPLVLDLKNAWASVVHNSSPSVASVIQGVPTFLTDADPECSQSCQVANKDLAKIENPDIVDRQAWIEKLSMCHWNFSELRSGEAWNFFKKYI